MVPCAKTAEPIKMPFGLWARMDRRNHVLVGAAAVLRDVAMATNFETEVAINWLCVNGSDWAIGYEGGLSGRPTECRYCRYLHLRDVAITTTFCLSVGYNFGCMIATRCLILGVGFTGSSYAMKT